MNIIVLILVGLMGLASSVNAAGFRLADQDAKATGMANAYTAVADNASAVWYNPAAITGLEGTNLSLGTVMVIPTMEHKNTDGTTDKIADRTHTPPHLYATRKINDQWSLGFGVNAPFGLSTKWDRDTAETRTVATRSNVGAANYNLNGAYKLNDKFSFAAGVAYVAVDATLNKEVVVPANAYGAGAPAATVDIEQELKGTGNGWGYNAAVMYRHSDKLSFGANYHSPVKVLIDGKINVPMPTTTVPALNALKTTSQDAHTKLTLPDMFQLGAAYKYSDKLLFSADVDYTDWSTYRKIVVDYTRDNNSGAQSKDVKNWQPAWAVRVGSEYKYSDAWNFRAGAFYDITPVPSKYFETRVPDANRLALSVGAGWNKGSVTVDVAYMYLMFMERKLTNAAASTTLDGKYTSAAHLPGITVGYKF